MTEFVKNLGDSLKTAADITALVGKAEDLYFEAKTCSDPFSEQDQGHLAEALAGFGNADGGVLIYGLVAAGGDRHKADVVTRVEHVKKLALLNSRILSLVGQLVEPPVPNVQVLPKEFDGLPGQGFLLVLVPPSDLGPHRSRKDREYYRRHGHGFFKMEHFEIAEMFGRRKSPALELQWQPYLSNPCIYKATSKRLQIKVRISLKNVGRGIAKYPALQIFGASHHDAGVDGNGSTGLELRPSSQGYLYGGGADHVIYPGSILEIDTVAHEFPVDSEQSRWSNLVIDYQIFAEEMVPIVKRLEISGDELQAACGSFRPIVWPSQ